MILTWILYSFFLFFFELAPLHNRQILNQNRHLERAFGLVGCPTLNEIIFGIISSEEKLKFD